MNSLKKSVMFSGLEFLASSFSNPLYIPDDLPPVEWVQQNFYLYDTRELLTLAEPQQRALEQAMLRAEDGTYRYRRILWSWPKKSAKSTIIAAVVHYTACHVENAQIALVANDQRQAASRVGFYLREAIRIGAQNGLASCKGVNVPKRDSGTITYPNGSRVEMLAVDPKGEAGGNHDMIVYSELWGWKHEAHQQMWAEMTISPNKFGYAQQWIDTYAGYDGESPILQPLYEHGVVNGTQIWDDFEAYENGDQFSTWVTKPMLEWQTPEYYESERAALTPEQFERLHRNQWITSTSAFIPAEWWDACKGNTIPRGQLVIALDAGVTSDCFGIVAVSRHIDRGNDIDEIHVRYVRAWYPGGKPLDYSEPLQYLEWLCRNHHVAKIVYDPYQLHAPMTEFKKTGLAWVAEFPQGIDRLKSDRALYDMIRDRRIKHENDNELNLHINSANRIENTGQDDNRFRIVKRNASAKIDLAVCLSMASYTAMRLNL